MRCCDEKVGLSEKWAGGWSYGMNHVQSWAPFGVLKDRRHCCAVYDMWIYYSYTPDAALADGEGGFGHSTRWVA